MKIFRMLQIVLLVFILMTLFSCSSSDSGGAGDIDGGTPGTGDTAVNQLPAANAGIDQIVMEQETITLTGSGADSDDTNVQYNWVQTSGETVSLDKPANASTGFLAPEIISEMTLTFQLTITDNNGATATDTVTIIVQDRVEQAVATGEPAFFKDSEEMLDAVINRLNTIKQDNRTHLQAIYGDSIITVKNPETGKQQRVKLSCFCYNKVFMS